MEYNKHYIKEYPGYVNEVFNNIDKLYKYIKTFGDRYIIGIKKYKKHFIFHSKTIQMDWQLEQCPVI